MQMYRGILLVSQWWHEIDDKYGAELGRSKKTVCVSSKATSILILTIRYSARKSSEFTFFS